MIYVLFNYLNVQDLIENELYKFYLFNRVLEAGKDESRITLHHCTFTLGLSGK